MTTKETKWIPQHFPAGTIVILNNSVDKTGDERTVTEIIRNGIDSYCFRFDEPCPHHVGLCHTVNISHVERIVKRGSGIVNVVADFDPISKLSKMAEKERQFIGNSLSGKKGHYLFTSNEFLFSLLVSRYAKFYQAVDHIGLLNAAIKAGLAKPVAGDWFYPLKQWNKKKLNRFIKQNINRFMLNPVKEQGRFDEAMYATGEDGWDRDFDERHPELGFNDAELKEDAEVISDAPADRW